MSDRIDETKKIKIDDETVEQLVENRYIPKENEYNSNKTSALKSNHKKKKKKRKNTGLNLLITLLAFVLVFVVFFLGSYIFFVSSPAKTPDNTPMIEETSLPEKKEEKTKNFKGELSEDEIEKASDDKNKNSDKKPQSSTTVKEDKKVTQNKTTSQKHNNKKETNNNKGTTDNKKETFSPAPKPEKNETPAPQPDDKPTSSSEIIENNENSEAIVFE